MEEENIFSLDSQSNNRRGGKRGGKPGVCWQLVRLPLNLQAVDVANKAKLTIAF